MGHAAAQEAQSLTASCTAYRQLAVLGSTQSARCHSGRASGDAQVGYSAIVFYGYVGVIGLALWAMLKWWFKSEVALAQVWCIYGARFPDVDTTGSGIAVHECRGPARHWLVTDMPSAA